MITLPRALGESGITGLGGILRLVAVVVTVRVT